MKKDIEWLKKEFDEVVEFRKKSNPSSSWGMGSNAVLKYIKEDFKNLIDQLDEPEKAEPLVVPKGLGEWLDNENLGNEGGLFSIIGRLEDMWPGCNFEEFITDNKKQLIEVILGNRGYEVEKEKLYYVLDKQGKTVLVLMDGEVRSSCGYEPHDGNKDMYQLTEKQIKDYDERFWQFAVEVAE